jgi:hypothetical protein
MACKNISALLVILLAVSAAPAAIAAPITFEFSGYINQADEDIDPLLASTFSYGDVISGSYTFDSTEPGVDGFYELTGFSVTVGGYIATYDASADPGFIYVGNDIEYAPGLYWDEYSVISDLDGPEVEGLTPYYASLGFFDYSATVFSSDALPLDASLLAPFGDGQFLMSFIDPQNDETYDLNGVITNVQTSVVPLPGALLLLLSGLASLFVAKKRSGVRL